MTDNLISKMREPKINMGGMDMAIFDLAGTVGGGYMVAKYMNWDKSTTILSAFVLGHMAHKMTGTQTPLSEKIDQTLSIPINNSTTPVAKDEIRFSTM
jgi:hypothetical protein